MFKNTFYAYFRPITVSNFLAILKMTNIFNTNIIRTNSYVRLISATNDSQLKCDILQFLETEKDVKIEKYLRFTTYFLAVCFKLGETMSWHVI